ncbi:MAG: hypothetical protein LBT50_06505 [Prevotellaceae bacterium]|nr:hypothetical protein [Prevotellaceae bacterium]
MRKVLVLLALVAMTSELYAQDIPSKLLKKIDVEVDEFTGNTKYKSKIGGVYILSKDGVNTLRWQILSIGATPVNIEKVQVLVNGKVTELDYTKEEYKSYTQMSRGVENTFSGGKLAQTFVDKEYYYEEIDIDAGKYLELFDSIIENKEAKLKYSGARDVVGVLDKKRVTSIKYVIELYKYLNKK